MCYSCAILGHILPYNLLLCGVEICPIQLHSQEKTPAIDANLIWLIETDQFSNWLWLTEECISSQSKGWILPIVYVCYLLSESHKSHTYDASIVLSFFKIKTTILSID